MSERPTTAAAVSRLLEQYRDYLVLSDQIKSLEAERLAVATAAAAKNGARLREVLSDAVTYPEVARLAEQINGLKVDLQNLSDAMTFATPEVWMRYKYEAYAGTATAIETMADLRAHCAKPGYICTKRYDFVRDELAKTGVDLDDRKRFPDDRRLDGVIADPAIMGLTDDNGFMKTWDTYEYNRDGERVAKWENYPKTI